MVASLSESLVCSAETSAPSSALPAVVLSLFAAVVVVFEAVVNVGRVAVLVAVVEVVLGREVEDVVAGLVGAFVLATLLGRGATLDLRSVVEVSGFVGARVLVVPAIDIRLAVPEMPFFSSPELATGLPFSSAELLTDARDLCPAVAVEAVDPVLRVVDVVVGRVGGLFSVLPLVVLVAVVVVVLVVLDVDPGRLVAVVPDTGRLVPFADVVLFLAGDDSSAFSLVASGLDFSGLVLASSPPDRMEESTGVSGGSFSEVTSTGWTGWRGSTAAMVERHDQICSRLVWLRLPVLDSVDGGLGAVGGNRERLVWMEEVSLLNLPALKHAAVAMDFFIDMGRQ